MLIRRLSEYEGTMELTGSGEVPLLQYKGLNEIPFIHHAFSTRLGGVSSGIYSSMNFKEDGLDANENIRENYRIVAHTMQVDVTKMVRSQLSHGTRVHEVEEQDFGVGVLAKSTLYDYDGLITNKPGVTLAATFADCVPLYFVDMKNHAVGLAHSGWRGTVNQIALSMLEAMKKAYGTKPGDLRVAVGPCICSSCYEVGGEFYDYFAKNFSGSIERETGIFFDRILKPSETAGKYYLDLRLANRMTFLKAGLREEQILVSDICTCCNPELIFSHRFTKGKRGVSAAFLGLKETAVL